MSSADKLTEGRILRGLKYLKRFALAMDYDPRDYTNDKISQLQSQVEVLHERLEQVVNSREAVPGHTELKNDSP